MYSETDFDVLNRFPTSYRNFDIRRNFYAPRIMKDSDFQGSKNSNFQNGLKYDLNKFRCWFWGQNGSKTSEGSIFNHITSFGTSWVTFSKIRFLGKIAIFCYFWRFTIRPINQPEVAGLVIGGRKCILLMF